MSRFPVRPWVTSKDDRLPPPEPEFFLLLARALAQHLYLEQAASIEEARAEDGCYLLLDDDNRKPRHQRILFASDQLDDIREYLEAHQPPAA